MVDERRRQPGSSRDATASTGAGSRSDRATRRPATAGVRSGNPGGSAESFAGRRRSLPSMAPTVVGSADRPGNPPAFGSVSTRAIFRFLLLRGLSEAEAANLTAFLCGLPIGERPWRLEEVNQLLFLRELHRSGRFGPGDVPPDLDEVPPPIA